MPGTNDWFQWAILSAIFAALTAIFAKVGLAGMDPDYATLVRTVVILGVLGVFVVQTGKWVSPWELSRQNILFLVLSGLATGASWVCYFRAIKLGDVSKVAPVDKLSLVLVALLAVVFLGERPTVAQWFGIGLVATGCVVLGWFR